MSEATGWANERDYATFRLAGSGCVGGRSERGGVAGLLLALLGFAAIRVCWCCFACDLP